MAEMLADLLWRLHAIPPMTGGDPSARVLHLDLHPDDVMVTPDGPVVIDWRNVTHGDPAFDLAMTALILAQAGLTMDEPVAEGAMATMYAFPRTRRPEVVGQAASAAARRRAENPTMKRVRAESAGAKPWPEYPDHADSRSGPSTVARRKHRRNQAPNHAPNHDGPLW